MDARDDQARSCVNRALTNVPRPMTTFCLSAVRGMIRMSKHFSCLTPFPTTSVTHRRVGSPSKTSHVPTTRPGTLASTSTFVLSHYNDFRNYSRRAAMAPAPRSEQSVGRISGWTKTMETQANGVCVRNQRQGPTSSNGALGRPFSNTAST